MIDKFIKGFIDGFIFGPSLPELSTSYQEGRIKQTMRDISDIRSQEHRESMQIHAETIKVLKETRQCRESLDDGINDEWTMM